MAPSERKEPGLGAPRSGSGSDGTDDDDFLNLIPDRLAPRATQADPADPADDFGPEDEFDPPPAPASAAPRARLSAGPAVDDDVEDEPEDYDDEPESRSGGSRGVMIAVVVGAVAAGIAGWYLFLKPEPEQTVAQTPVIAADGQPYKVRPADPGGMQVPNTDKMVYDRLGQNSQAEGGVENLLAQPAAPTAPPPPSEPVAEEQPAEPAPVPEQQVATAPTPQPVPTPPAPVVTAPAQPTPAPQAQAPAAPAPTPAPAPKPAPAPAPQPQVAAVTPAPAPAPVAAAPAGGGSMMVQLAALKDEASARAAWNQAVAANKDLLGNLNMDIQRADLGAKGVFYRVRAKGLASAAEAKALCDKLAARKVGCIVVR
ncbi:SPOR domain-containing protein [Caenispirillum bisanense]|uniref:Sporulation related domain-containing protein n=1 Tax=Caenispirillum bisanense TaxID=414052 RepID=A0A286H031_9PROT|nr:SPOR domain-containing protein [Caenispirillum bisanense]SOE01133.1 Sporulation related domain-containing protein [Caenispirillum bisanense]